MRVTEISCSFRLVLERETGKEIPKSSSLEFLEKFFTKYFALSDADDNTSGLLNRGGVSDLPLRTLLAICQKSQEPSFWEVIDSFVLVAYVSLAASRTLLQRLLACLYFPLNSEGLFYWHKLHAKNEIHPQVLFWDIVKSKSNKLAILLL